MPARTHRTLAVGRFAIAFVAAVTALTVLPGCRQATVEVVHVETVENKPGRNVAPLRNEMLAAAERGVERWIEGDREGLSEVFTEQMMIQWDAARGTDRSEEVRKVRVHTDRRYVPTSMDDERPRLRYEFVDRSYFVDAASGQPLTEPYDVAREIVFVFAREDGTLKIDSMIGSPEALR